jgi:mannosyl-oligosaccharide alpha-1,2-mannosidase
MTSRKGAILTRAQEGGRASWPQRPETQFFDVGTPISQAPDPDEVTAARRDAVKSAMLHSWRGYQEYGWGQDEYAPVKRQGVSGAAPGATIVDSMSTLKVMGLEKEFNEAVAWVTDHDFRLSSRSVSVFETTIRVLGGLLSAYDMTGDRDLLRKATEVGDGLLGAFTSASTGIPAPEVVLGTGAASGPTGKKGLRALLAELGTNQLEMRQLSHHTGNSKYSAACDKVSRLLESQSQAHHGLWNTFSDRVTGQEAPPTLLSFGAKADST